MFIVLSKLFLVLDKDDLSPRSKGDKNKYFVIYDLKQDSRECKHVEWPILNSSSLSTSNHSLDFHFTSGSFSLSHNLLAISDNKKNLFIFDRFFKQTNHYFKLKKNAVKIVFSKNEDLLLVCDKSGDIYEFDLKSNSERLLLGHCSMLLDFTLTDDHSYIISADRDEKIRVTHYPNTYSIKTYCLGHTEFVSSIQLINDEILASGSGDGKIKIWNYLKGENIFTYDCESKNDDEQLSNESTKKSDFPIKSLIIDQIKSHLCVSSYTKPLILLFKINYTSDGKFSSLNLINQLSLNIAPTLIAFDLNHINFLWIFGPSETKHEAIKLMELKQNQLTNAMMKTNVIDELNQNEHFQKSLMKDEMKVENLFKHSFDNTELERKRS